MNKISLVTIAKNEEKNIEEFLSGVKWADEIIVVDNCSKDSTLELAKKYTQKVYINCDNNLGRLKQYAISKATNEWILLLDVDEIVSKEMGIEIQYKIHHSLNYEAYRLHYINHFNGHPLISEKYFKIRLFKKNVGSIKPSLIHEEVNINSPKVGDLQAHILHYSYRGIIRVLNKFTEYAIKESTSLLNNGEKTTFRKITLYPLHMFYVRFFKDQGYKDGIWGFLLALCFAYYEFARYYYLWRARKQAVR
jgi:glycosyltransferase involved in cell wall biosynthesis